MPKNRFQEHAATPVPTSGRSTWVDEHIRQVPERLAKFLDEEGRELTGARVLDIGCGDGLIDVGLCWAFEPAHLVATDLVATDEAALRDLIATEFPDRSAPSQIEFVQVDGERLPFDDDSFDVVLTWSVFEHAEDLFGLCREVYRVLRPNGRFFIQTYPLWYSPHGSHLWDWYPEGFAHLGRSAEQIEREVRERDGDDPEWAEYLLTCFRSTNRATVDDIQAALRGAGFYLAKAGSSEVVTHLPPHVQGVDLSKLLISEVMLLAVRAA